MTVTSATVKLKLIKDQMILSLGTGPCRSFIKAGVADAGDSNLIFLESTTVSSEILFNSISFNFWIVTNDKGNRKVLY